MKTLLILSFSLILLSCGSQDVANKSPAPNSQPVDTVVTEAPNESSSPPKIQSLRYFETAGIWDTLLKISTHQHLGNFHIKDFHKEELINIDSTSVAQAIREISSLKSVYPLRVFPHFDDLVSLVFFGEQYDADQITDFLAIATLNLESAKKGAVEALSARGEFMGESWEYFAEFQSDRGFRVTRIDQNTCVDEMGDSRAGEISLLKYVQVFDINSHGEIVTIKNDTLAIEYCKFPSPHD